ncbi:hypothetical protein HCU64_03900 [Methylobacterium sp. C25]|uniref:hypothetical protein n=1 Tax=Methylobacterium sp. C25 TaxID=2721622 RepID=UPI003FA36F09|nr:hypothetical protein [Methylobacterium sp. C25]
MSRQERLKSALRDNLKRRKEQARGRAQTIDHDPEQTEPRPPAETPAGSGNDGSNKALRDVADAHDA